MRRVSPFFTFSRGIRRRGGPTPPPDFPAQTTTGTSAGILDEAATFSDVHSVLLNPTTRLPYPERELRDHLEKSGRDVLKEKNKAKYGTSKKKSSDIVFDHIPLEEQMFLLFPGQGSQFVGMGKKVIDCPASKRLFEEGNEHLGYDLTKICLEGPSTKLDQTLYCQPAVFVSSLAALEKLKEQEGGSEVVDRITHVAGFSVGEYAAMVAGGMLSFSDALKIVKIRAEAMHECNQLVASGMMTVKVNASSRLEDAMEDAREKARKAGEMEICEIANFLFCGVRVVGASQLCLDFLEDCQQNYNFQVVKRLAVSGAFHTRQMDSAVEKVRKAVQEAKLQPARCNVYSNFTGNIFPARKAEIRQAIFKQVNSPVKWEQIQQLLYRKHKDFTFPRFIEVGPGRQLGAMLLQTSKKAYKNYEHFSC